MENETLKVNLLAIALSGLLMCLAAGSAYLFKHSMSTYSRFFLPIPPLGIAAYVFVVSLFKHYNGNLPTQHLVLISEILYSTVLAALIFGLFTVVLVLSIQFLKAFL